MKSATFGAIAALAMVAAGCAQLPVGPEDAAAARAQRCVSLFRQLDAFDDLSSASFEGLETTMAPAIPPLATRLQSNDCITFSRDLGGLAAAPGAAAAPQGDVGRARRGPVVHVGAVTSHRDDARALDYFAALGYPAYSVGSPGVGRRVYVGPVADEAEAGAVIEAARRAGFAYPYIERTGSSFFGGFVQRG